MKPVKYQSEKQRQYYEISNGMQDADKVFAATEFDRVAYRYNPKTNDVLAFLPDLPARAGKVVYYCGQHGETDWGFYYATISIHSKAAQKYTGLDLIAKELRSELLAIGYKLREVKRIQGDL